MLEGCAHIAGRLRVGAHEFVLAAKIGDAVQPRGGRRIFAGEQVMPRGLGLHLVDRRHHAAGMVGAQPDMVAVRRPEAADVIDLRPRYHDLHRPADPARASAASTVGPCIEFFWPKPPPTKGEIDVDDVGGDIEGGRHAVPHGLGVLRPS